ncbi:MAG: hypothetical protein ACI9F2_000073 [Lysobacterales bacterium]|jgi:hypothetical protein
MKKMINKTFKNLGQTAVEYLLLLSVVGAIALIALNSDMGKFNQAGELYFNKAAEGILGPPPSCGDDICDRPYEDEAKCCVDCDGC